MLHQSLCGRKNDLDHVAVINVGAVVRVGDLLADGIRIEIPKQLNLLASGVGWSQAAQVLEVAAGRRRKYPGL